MRATFLRRLIAVIVSVVVIAATVRAQGPQAAAQLIRGRVVSADTGQPLPNARVAVAGTSIADRAGLDGRFALSAPPDAMLVVTKAGFVRLEETLASRRNSTQPLDLRLTRATAVAGRVTNEYGDPVVGVMVLVANRADRIQTVATLVSTDDRGDYRVGGLRPGTYTVSVRTGGSGVATLVRLDTIPEMRALVAAERDAAVPREREALLTAQVLMSPTFTTFYPAAADEANAAALALAAGDERSDIDFHLPMAQSLRQTGSVYPQVAALQDLSIPTNGTASIRGIIASSTGRALPHAVVRLVEQKNNTFLTATAGDDGRYVFASLHPGIYRVAASKPGYSLTPGGMLVASALGEYGIPVTVAADDARDQVNLTLQPWGSITGHVFDEAGEPVMGALVGLSVPRYEGGRRRLVTAGMTQRRTDDRGEFRLFGIPDGQYVLGATVIDSPTRSIGGYAPTFYPGTGSGAEVQFVTVAAGDDIKGLDFNLAMTPASRVSGTLVDAQGRPTTGGRFTLLSRSALAVRIDAIINADGTFEFRNIPPGPYVIQADRGKLGPSVEGEFAGVPVTVGRNDVTGVTVQTSTGTTINGHVGYDSITSTVPPRAAIAFSAIPVDFDLAPPNLAVGEPDAEGTFKLTGITGVRRLQATGLPDGWMVKSIISDGIDVTDQPLQFGQPGQPARSFDVVLGDRLSVVSGTVTDDKARRVPGARVVIFTADRERWYPASRFVRSTATTPEGSFSVAGLPIGSYLIAPVARVPDGVDAWRDPALLDSLRPSARSVTVGDGDTQTVNLRVSSR